MAREIYTPENPHPGFGKDPNIKNEFGHTHYPKWVVHYQTNERVLVENPLAEEEALGKDTTSEQSKDDKKKPKNWN